MFLSFLVWQYGRPKVQKQIPNRFFIFMYSIKLQCDVLYIDDVLLHLSQEGCYVVCHVP
jgi:hypothetical protein